MTGFSSSTIAKLAKNEVVKLDVVERICEALEVLINDVVEITHSKGVPISDVVEITHSKGAEMKS